MGRSGKRKVESSWSGGYWLSLTLHASLVALALFGNLLFRHVPVGGHDLGTATAGTIVANLVTKTPGGSIPMPAPVMHQTVNRLANDTPGPTVTEHHPPPPPPKDAVPIPVPKPFKPKDLAHDEALRELKRLAEADRPKKRDNRVQYGSGGRVSMDSSMKQEGVGGGGGVSFGDAAFGSLYAAWVNHLRDRLTFYWNQQIRPVGVPAGQLVYIQFTVNRAGQLYNIGFGRRSGNAGLDAMALHAVQAMSVSERDPLPASYPRSSLDIQVTFELQ